MGRKLFWLLVVVFGSTARADIQYELTGSSKVGGTVNVGTVGVDPPITAWNVTYGGIAFFDSDDTGAYAATALADGCSLVADAEELRLDGDCDGSFLEFGIDESDGVDFSQALRWNGASQVGNSPILVTEPKAAALALLGVLGLGLISVRR